MAPERIWTSTELEALTPDERDAVVRSGFVTDPDGHFGDLIERARRKAGARISDAESSQTAR
jgi:hypothetical protein